MIKSSQIPSKEQETVDSSERNLGNGETTPYSRDHHQNEQGDNSSENVMNLGQPLIRQEYRDENVASTGHQNRQAIDNYKRNNNSYHPSNNIAHASSNGRIQDEDKKKENKNS